MNAPRVAQENPFSQSYVDAANADPADPALAYPEEEDFSRAAWEFARVERFDGSVRQGEKCSNCGQWRQSPDEEDHETVRRVVREGATVGYGESMVHAGGDVWVEPRHLAGALLDTTCSPRQWIAMHEAKRRRHEARPPAMLDMIRRSSAVAKAGYEETNKRGRDSMLDQLRAAGERANALRRIAPADQEDPHPGRRDVTKTQE